MASVLANAQITMTPPPDRAPQCPGTSSTYLGKAGAISVAEILPTTKPMTQAQRLLQDHAGDGAVLGADELEHRDFADFAQRHRVDDEGDDGGADQRQDGQEHADLPGRGGNELADQDLLHLRARVA
jgi:hypothetical protein